MGLSRVTKAIKELGMEGIVSKNPTSHYFLDSRPQNVWIKTKNYLYDTFQTNCYW